MIRPSVAWGGAALIRGVEGGMSLSDAFQRHPNVFVPLYVSMIAAGEKGQPVRIALAGIAEPLGRQGQGFIPFDLALGLLAVDVVNGHATPLRFPIA